MQDFVQLGTKDNYKNIFELLEENRPDVVKATVPRRIASTSEYLNPKYFSVIHYSFADGFARNGHNDEAVTTAFFISNLLAEQSVPCYFLKEDFLHCLIHTSPPESMLIGDIKMPNEAMLFFYPESFSKQYFGLPVLCTGVGRFVKDQIVKIPYHVPGVPKSFSVQMSQAGTKEQLSIFSNVLEAGGTSTFYGTFPNHKTIKDVAIDSIEYFGSAEGIGNNKADVEIGNKLNSLAIKIILGMVARPQYVEFGALLRKGGEKRGVEINELWSPNYIGRTLKLKRENLGGTHASPRFHFRKGHFRGQHYGLNNNLIKVIWIEPTAVGS